MVNGYIIDCPGGTVRPEDIYLHGFVVRSKAEVEDEIVLVSLPGSRCHLSGKDSPIRKGYLDLSADSEKVDLLPVT